MMLVLVLLLLMMRFNCIFERMIRFAVNHCRSTPQHRNKTCDEKCKTISRKRDVGKIFKLISSPENENTHCGKESERMRRLITKIVRQNWNVCSKKKWWNHSYTYMFNTYLLPSLNMQGKINGSTKIVCVWVFCCCCFFPSLYDFWWPPCSTQISNSLTHQPNTHSLTPFDSDVCIMST